MVKYNLRDYEFFVLERFMEEEIRAFFLLHRGNPDRKAGQVYTILVFVYCIHAARRPLGFFAFGDRRVASDLVVSNHVRTGPG